MEKFVIKVLFQYTSKLFYNQQFTQTSNFKDGMKFSIERFFIVYYFSDY